MLATKCRISAETTVNRNDRLDSPLAMNECYRKSENIVTRRIAGQTLLVPVAANVADLDSLYMLNEMGTRIWELIGSNTTLDKVVETITREYDVEPEEAATSILEFINSLCEARLIASESRTANGATEL
jgi:Coenzyme PQQ synthesis protein D (PqqD)